MLKEYFSNQHICIDFKKLNNTERVGGTLNMFTSLLHHLYVANMDPTIHNQVGPLPQPRSMSREKGMSYITLKILSTVLKVK